MVDFEAESYAAAKAIKDGDKTSLADILNKEDLFKRAQTARGAAKILDDERARNPAIPQIEIQTDEDFDHREILTDISRAGEKKESIYAVPLVKSAYQRDYSFSHSTQKEYFTSDPRSQKIVSSEISTPGDSAHVDYAYSNSGRLSSKHLIWRSGIDEKETFDDKGHIVEHDASWMRADGTKMQRNEKIKWNDSYKESSELRINDGSLQVSIYDEKARIVKQDSFSNDKKTFSFEQKFDSTTDKRVFERRASAEGYSQTTPYDSKTGDELTNSESSDFGKRQSYRESTYDPFTHAKTAFDETTNYGQKTHEKFSPSGKLLDAEYSINGRISTVHNEYNSRDNLTKSEQHSSREDSLEQITYDATGRTVVDYSKETSSQAGNRSKVEAHYENGEIVSEDLSWTKGDLRSEHIDYKRRADEKFPGKTVLEIHDSQTEKDGTVKKFDYEYRYNEKLNSNILHLKWKGSNPDGSFSNKDESVIQRFQFQHLPKAVKELR